MYEYEQYEYEYEKKGHMKQAQTERANGKEMQPNAFQKEKGRIST